MTSIEDIVAMQYDGGGVQVTLVKEDGRSEEKFQEKGFVLLEPSFFEIFDYSGHDVRWIAGNPEKCFK